MPKINSLVTTPDGSGSDTGQFFNLTAKVEFPDGKFDFYNVEELDFREKASDEDIDKLTQKKSRIWKDNRDIDSETRNRR